MCRGKPAVRGRVGRGKLRSREGDEVELPALAIPSGRDFAHESRCHTAHRKQPARGPAVAGPRRTDLRLLGRTRVARRLLGRARIARRSGFFRRAWVAGRGRLLRRTRVARAGGLGLARTARGASRRDARRTDRERKGDRRADQCPGEFAHGVTFSRMRPRIEPQAVSDEAPPHG